VNDESFELFQRRVREDARTQNIIRLTVVAGKKNCSKVV